MGFRPTERRLPEDLSSDDLGEISEPVVQGVITYIMVSYLTAPLHRLSSGGLAKNTYVVFGIGATGSESVECTWTVEGYIENHQAWVDWAEVPEDEKTRKGIFELTSDYARNMVCLEFMSNIRVTAHLSNGVELQLEQALEPPRKDIAALINVKKKGPSRAGRGEVTEIVVSSYGNYIKDLGSVDPVIDTDGNRAKRRLVVAIVYWTILNQEKLRLHHDAELWERYINENTKGPDLETAILGIAGIRPVLLPLFVGNDYFGGAPPFVSSPPTTSSEQNGYFEELFNSFAALNTDDKIKIDLYNLLRFPKTSLRLCCLILEKLKERHPEWATLKWDKLVENPDFVRQLLFEYNNGPGNESADADRAIPKDIAELILTSYVGMIAAKDLCDALRGPYFVKIPQKATDPIRDAIKGALPESPPRNVKTTIEVEFGNLNLDLAPRQSKEYVLGFQVRLTFDMDYPDRIRACSLTVRQFEWRRDESAPALNNHDLDLVPVNGLNEELYKRLFTYRRLGSVARDGAAGPTGPTHMKYELEYAEDDVQILGPDPSPQAAIQVFLELLDLLEWWERTTICLLAPPSGGQPSSPGRSEIILFFIDRLRELLGRWEQIRLRAGYGVVMPSFDTVPSGLIMQGPVASPSWLELPEAEQVNFPDLDRSGINKWPPLYANKVAYMDPIRIEFAHDKPGVGELGDDVLADGQQLIKIVAPGSTKSTLEDWVDRAELPPNPKLVIRGYADKSYAGTGDRTQHNQKLSERRAAWVENRLPAALKSLFAGHVSIEGCGDKYAPDIPPKNPSYKDARLIIELDEE